MNHKTATSKGPAQLVIPQEMKHFYDKFAALRRGRGDNNLFFVNNQGIKSSRLARCIQTFTKHYSIDLPDPPTHRKVVSTKASALHSEDQEKVAALMKHSVATQRRYYRNMESSHDTIDAYNIVSNSLMTQPSSQRQPARRFKYDKDDEDKIRSWFSDHIKSGKRPTVNLCRKQNQMSNRNAQHVRDKLKHLYAKHHDSNIFSYYS